MWASAGVGHRPRGAAGEAARLHFERATLTPSRGGGQHRSSAATTKLVDSIVNADELIVQEHKYFYWNTETAQTCWEPPDENRKVLWNMFRGRKARRKVHEAEMKRLAELEEERRHRLGQGTWAGRMYDSRDNREVKSA